MMNDAQRFDIAVIGAGFSGSLTALGLHQLGYDVILLEKDTHPRFAIGESSTPIADLILRDLSDRYDLPWLRDISRYGSWQQTYPEISCGLKRGFSYFKHRAGQPFQTDESHKNELLVAASTDDERSDTNWFRSDIDAFFVEKVQESGIPYRDNTQITSIRRLGGRWKIESENETFDISWLIDATGSDAILGMLGIKSESTNFRTNTRAIYSHFSSVKPWQKWLHENNISTEEYPYNPDHSALHHLLDEGWLWMLRFNNGITSCGLVLNRSKNVSAKNKQEIWTGIISKYPPIKDLFKNAKLANLPGQLIQTGRLQRKAGKAAGDGWVALPHTVGFVDPLHSTGIAHSLTGVERILYAFETGRDNPDIINKLLSKYGKAVFNELDLVDLLVDGGYRSINHFELFNIYTMLYFMAAITYEQKRISGNLDIETDHFLSANHHDIRIITGNFYDDIRLMRQRNVLSKIDLPAFRNDVKKAIEPYNMAGLLNPDPPNMYHHTAAEF